MALTLANHPIGRISAPAEIARAVAFLAASDIGGIIGTILGVDGGTPPADPGHDRRRHEARWPRMADATC